MNIGALAPSLPQPSGTQPGVLQGFRADAGQDFTGRVELLRQAATARDLDAPFVAHILEAAFRQLSRAPRISALVDGWPGDRAAGAVALRLNSGLHAIARRGDIPELTALYSMADDTHTGAGAPPLLQPELFDRAVRSALDGCEAELLTWMAGPTQTNEVGRVAALMAALMDLGATGPHACEILELGASAGLNLNLDRYAYRLAGTRAGDPHSSVIIAPEWRGDAPKCRPVEVASSGGVDLNPLNVADPQHRERLMAFVWPGDRQRSARLSAAIDVALRFPPLVDKGIASAWLAERLKRPQPSGVRRVVFHSMVLQYMSEVERHTVTSLLMQAGSCASRDRPFAWIGLEWKSDRSEVLLTVTDWLGDGSEGRTRTLARCHPYGDWIEWRGEA